MFFNTRTRCFMEAARCLNFTKAAERLYISQPALSKNIATLEQECGMKLFSRSARQTRISLTPAGAVLLCELTKAEKIISGVERKAKAAEEGKEGNLVIGMVFGQIINRETKHVWEYMSSQYPNVKIEKRSNGYKVLRDWLEDGVTDTIVTLEEEAKLIKDVVFEEVARVPLGFVVPTDNPLAHKRRLTVADVKDQCILILSPKESFSIYDEFRERCYLEGFKPIEVEERDLNSLHLSVEVGNGITVSRSDMMITKSPNVKFFPCGELGEAVIVAAWKKENLNPIIALYHNLYEKEYHNGIK